MRRFILGNALTVPDVEALLMLRGSPGAGCDADLLASRLYLSRARADAVAAKLRNLGAVEQLGDATGMVYRPRTTELSAVIDSLLSCYARNLVQVAQLIHSTEIQSAQAFADAFRIRKEI